MQEGRPGDEVYAVGQERRLARLRGHSLCEGAVPAFAGHSVARPEAVDVVADRNNDPGGIRARDVRELRAHLIAAASHQIVHVADGSGVNFDQHFVGSWTGFGRFAES